MLNVGLFELIFFISFALIFLGPEKLIELVRNFYHFYKKLKTTIQTIQTDLERELKLNELQNTLEAEINKVKDLERLLSQKIYADYNPNQIIYISMPYSQLNRIIKINPEDHILFQEHCYSYSYSMLNTHLLNASQTHLEFSYD